MLDRPVGGRSTSITFSLSHVPMRLCRMPWVKIFPIAPTTSATCLFLVLYIPAPEEDQKHTQGRIYKVWWNSESKATLVKVPNGLLESVGKSGHDIQTARTCPEVYPECGN
jgi:hypothetical protein